MIPNIPPTRKNPNLLHDQRRACADFYQQKVGKSALAAALLSAAQFVSLHGVDGQNYLVNPEQITSMREPAGADRNHFPAATHCIIVTTSGKFMAVKELCEEIRGMITQKGK